MDETAAAPTPAAEAPFRVGYDNGYGYRPEGVDAAPTVAPALDGSHRAGAAALTAPYLAPDAAAASATDPSFARTQAVPVHDLALALTEAGDAEVAPVAPGPAAHRGMRRSLVLGVLAFLVLAGAVALVVATRPGGSAFANASAASAPRAAHSVGTRLDEHGNVIADSVAVLPGLATTVPTTAPTTGPTVVDTTPGTQAPVTTVPVTSAPTTAPTVPPTTAAPTTTSTAPTTTSTTIPKPKVLTFDHPSSVSCANPANQVPYIPLSWTTQNAVKVTISIDGPGVYKTYPGASGNDTVPFSCPGPHTYLITAYSATNQVVTQQVVITKS